MAVIHPFKAWRPVPEKVEEVSCVPYDVVSTREASRLAEGNPDSFLHVIRPEIDLPEGTAFNADAVYKKGKENLAALMEKGVLIPEEHRTVYIYRLHDNGHAQTGIFTCVSVEDYNSDVILKHELTRPDKEDDRTRHILTQSAHAEPVMMTYRNNGKISGETDRITGSQSPIYDFTAEDGVRHTVWKADDASRLVEAFSNIPHLYIADGHHRCKSASRAAEELKNKNPGHTGDEEYNFFPAVLIPVEQMRILAYNRVIFSAPGEIIDTLQNKFETFDNAPPAPERKGEISIYTTESRWLGLKLPAKSNPNSVEALDVYRLQEYILEPLLEITDPRTNENISFVGGKNSTYKLENMVDSGKADLAVSVYPTCIDELMEVSDEGRLMPPKSTWFEPKLRSGLLVHTF